MRRWNPEFEARLRRTAGENAGRERGFVLPLAVVILAGVFLLGTALFTVSRTDLAIVRSHDAALRAFYAAESGIASGLTAPAATPPALLTWEEADVRTTLRMTRLLALDSVRTLYRIEAEALVSRPGGGVARRTLVVLAVREPGAPPAVRAGTWGERFR